MSATVDSINHDLIPLSTADLPAVAHVGGKAAALIRLRQAGFTVPDGVVLTSHFFLPWFAAIQSSDEWRGMLELLPTRRTQPLSFQQRAEFTQACERVKLFGAALPIHPDQHLRIASTLSAIGTGPYAVRSSSPEEDLAGASFAGLYETVLGANAPSLPDAIRTCSCSCLDARVLLYKSKLGLDVTSPAIAVLVQRMVAAEISGVAFSLNPLANDFDEILINASWGLGEGLVGGGITPDSIVIDKISHATLEYRAGNKGGDRAHTHCLSNVQIAELVATVKRIEARYRDPVDVEWAIAGSCLHVLQARPITAYVPLHPSLQTAPGAPRRLYMDGFLTDGITMSNAVTPLSNDLLVFIYKQVMQWMLNVQVTDSALADYGIHTRSERMYTQLSMYMHLMGKGENLASTAARMNPIIAGILMSPDFQRYRPTRPAPNARIAHFLRYAPGVLWRVRRAVTVLLGPVFRRARFDADYPRAITAFNAWIAQPLEGSQSVVECATAGLRRAGETILTSSYPAFLLAYINTARIRGLARKDSPQQIAWADAICSGYEDDMIVQMGLRLFDLAALLPPAEFDDINALAEKLERRDLSGCFLAQWDEFITRYGCRGPLEMELANPKYADAPELALRQMATFVTSGDSFNPHDMQRTQIQRREAAYAQLRAALPPRKARRLQRLYGVCMRYAGAREMFKHHIMQVYARVRTLLLLRADEFIHAGRLDRREQIFELTMDDVDRATAEPALDLRALVTQRGAWFQKLKRHVRHFPMVIDSRGRILRAPRRIEAGSLVGTAVSPGVARGPIKILNDPFEKDLLPGDVLVAVTTDPGWTPLFISAAAVILEIGGELQHGALVAREYGKPCVSGIQDVTAQFTDGQIVEVDGDAGVVRFC